MQCFGILSRLPLPVVGDASQRGGFDLRFDFAGGMLSIRGASVSPFTLFFAEGKRYGGLQAHYDRIANELRF